MKDVPADPNAWSELEALLLACLERPDAERARALEELCDRHPQHAVTLRQRFATLAELGFVGAAQRGTLLPGRQLGDYTLRERLGGGAMGVVWLAEQRTTHRQVALKLLRSDLLDEERARERFRRELEATARLEHPGICPVYDAGESDGQPFIAMRYVPGEALSEAIARTRRMSGRGDVGDGSSSGSNSVVLAATDEGSTEPGTGEPARVLAAVALVEQTARALHAAHERGLVHRDVKPANILVTAGSEPVLVDFGLARDDVAADPTLTLSGDRLGTPAYMAPEQIEPRGRRADCRTDTYALGAVLFECLTLHAPFEAPSREALYRQILTTDPPDPRHWNPRVPGDLAVVVQKALDKDPSRRYSTALEFADDLRRVRTREPVRARPAGRWLRARRWAQRNPLLAGALAGSFLFLAVGLAVSLTLLVRVQDALAQRRAGDVAALAVRSLEHDTTLAALCALEAFALEPSNPTTVSAMYAATADLREERVQSVRSPYCVAAPSDGRYFVVGSDQTSRAWIYRDGMEPVELHTARVGHRRLHRIIVSPDGRRILAMSVWDQQSPGAGLATVWDPDRPDEPVARLPHPGEVLTGCFSSTGQVVTGCVDGVTRLWSADGRHVRELKGHTAAVYSCTVSPDGELLVTGSLDCTVRRWDARTATAIGEPIPHGGWVVAIDFAPAGIDRGDRFVTATGYDDLRTWRDDPGFGDDTARVFDRDGTLLTTLEGHTDRIIAARFSPDGRHIVTTSADREARLWRLDAEGGSSLVARLVHDGKVYGVCFDATGARIATVSFSGTAYLWGLDGRSIGVLRGHRVCATGCCFVGDRLVTTGIDDTVRTWTAASPYVASWRHTDLACATYARHGTWIVVAEHRGIVHVWDRAESRIPVVPPFDTGVHNVVTLSVSAEGERILIGDEDGELHLFGLDGSRIGRVQAHARQIKRAQFSPIDDDLILTGSYDGVVRLWHGDLSQRVELVPAPVPASTVEPGEPVWDTAFSADGLRVATATDDPGKYTVKVFLVDALLAGRSDPEAVLGPHDYVVRKLSFAPGQRLLCSTLLGSAWLWDLADRTETRIVRLERDATCIAASPHGDVVAVGLMDGTVHLLGTDGSARFVLPRSEEGRIRSLDFLPDGSRLLVGVSNGLVTEWIVDPEVLRQLVEHRGLARALSANERQVLDDLRGR